MRFLHGLDLKTMKFPLVSFQNRKDRLLLTCFYSMRLRL